MDNSSETMEDIALINNLNDHCLIHIFSSLSIEERLGIEKVCKRWRMISEQGWNDLKGLIINDGAPDDGIHLVFKRCGRYLKNLTIHYAPEYSHSLSMAVKFCRLDELEEIDISDRDLKEWNVERNICNIREILVKSRKLVAVTIQGCFSNDMLDHLNFLNPKILRKLVLNNSREGELSINPDRFPNLKRLVLDRIDIIQDEMTREDESLKGLEDLSFSRCEVPENFIKRISTFTNLRDLGLCYNDLNIKEHIRQIVRHCHSIKRMILTNSVVQQDGFLQYLGEMSSLEIINFLNFDMDTRDLAYLTNVKKLSFHLCFDTVKADGLIELIANSSNLEELQFIDIRALSKQFLDGVKQIFQNGQRTKHLIVTLKGESYKVANYLEEMTPHPLLKLRVDNNDFVEGENDTDDTGDYDDHDDYDDDYGNDYHDYDDDNDEYDFMFPVS